MAAFGNSTFGKSIVIAEGVSLPPLRVAFTVLTLALGACALLHVGLRLLTLLHNRSRPGTSQRSLTLLFAAYACHLVVHTAHFADNIARPVVYFEPEWLYVRYLVSTMEITFFFNLPMTLAGAICAAALLEAHAQQTTGQIDPHDHRTKQLWSRGMLIYASMSGLTLMHYMVEPPPSYAPEVNFTIAGEGVTALVLMAAVVSFQSGSSHNDISDSKTDPEVLAQEDATGGGARSASTHIRRRSGSGR